MLILHYNSSCRKCVRLAKRTTRLDWLNRFQVTTEPSPIGIPKPGEIVVVDNKSARLYSGVYATRIVCLNLPVYFVLGLFLLVPSILRLIAGTTVGCNGEACDL